MRSCASICLHMRPHRLPNGCTEPFCLPAAPAPCHPSFLLAAWLAPAADVLADEAEKFIQQYKRDRRPFFAWIAPYAPHTPALPAVRHRGVFRGEHHEGPISQLGGTCAVCE